MTSTPTGMSRSWNPCTKARASASSEMSLEIHGSKVQRGVYSGGTSMSSASVQN
jgi:hypothetical protein